MNDQSVPRPSQSLLALEFRFGTAGGTRYCPLMSTVPEIEQAIESLPPADYAALLAWLDERRAVEVDAKFEQAILAGKFDAMAGRALSDAEAGKCTPLDEFLRRA